MTTKSKTRLGESDEGPERRTIGSSYCPLPSTVEVGDEMLGARTVGWKWQQGYAANDLISLRSDGCVEMSVVLGRGFCGGRSGVCTIVVGRLPRSRRPNPLSKAWLFPCAGGK